jgi:hypothetical protein
VAQGILAKTAAECATDIVVGAPRRRGGFEEPKERMEHVLEAVQLDVHACRTKTFGVGQSLPLERVMSRDRQDCAR